MTMELLAPPSIANHTFVIVEDERVIAMDLAESIRALGGLVIGVASNANDACVLATTAKPNLMLMDIHLRGSPDGIEAATRVRADSDVPVVFLTAHADRATLERAKIASPYGYLVKPFDERSLEATILTALERHRAFRDLDALVAERTASLEAAVSARDEFLLVATHELRTPIAASALQIEALSRLVDRVSPDDPIRERLVDKVRSVKSQGARLGRLVERLLDAQSIALGRLRLHPSDLELGAVVEGVALSFRARALAEGSTIDYRCVEPIHGRWDRERLEQVVSNLLDNALKYAGTSRIEITVSRGSGCARIEVRDRGIGIDPSARERIFERFERGVSTTNFGGLGLGLSIVKTVVEAHRGHVSVSSPPDGVGSVFAVSLPVDERS